MSSPTKHNLAKSVLYEQEYNFAVALWLFVVFNIVFNLFTYLIIVKVKSKL